MSLLRKYLNNGGSLEELADKYLIKTRRHYKYNNLVLFTYDIGCKFDEPFQLECRGIILDEDDNWKVISQSFNKFFNIGESRATPIDWGKATVREKLDGSLLCVYKYKNEIICSTSGTPDANTPIGDYNYTFEQIFYEALRENNLYPLPFFPEGVTIIFELCTEYNRIVVPHQGKKIYLLDARDTRNGFHFGNDLHGFEHFPKPKQYNYTNVDELLASIETFKGIEQEGYVVNDGVNFLKVKHPEYVTLHHTISGINLKSIVSIALKGEVDETLAYFPHLTEELNKVKQQLEEKVKELDDLYSTIKNLPTRKEFALSIKDNTCRSILFNMKDKNISALEVLREERIENVINYLKG